MSLLQKKIIVPVISSQPGNCAGSDHCTAVKVFLRFTNSLQDRVPEEHIGYEVGDLRTAGLIFFPTGSSQPGNCVESETPART